MGSVRSGAGGNGMTDIEKYNNILSSVGACIFITDCGYGWYWNSKTRKGFKTAEEAYEDACREIEIN